MLQQDRNGLQDEFKESLEVLNPLLNLNLFNELVDQHASMFDTTEERTSILYQIKKAIAIHVD